jgi:hypothetical protein
LRHVENLNTTKEEVVYICETDLGENLSVEEEKRSVKDIIEFQEGRDELSNCRVGNKKISVEDIIYFQEGRGGSSNF